jgi:hypothetical protein
MIIMASIRLPRSDLESGLPMTCILCGGAAAERCERALTSPHPRWKWLLYGLFVIAIGLSLSLRVTDAAGLSTKWPAPLKLAGAIVVLALIALWLIGGLLTRQRVRARIPYCSRHAQRWRWGNRLGRAGLVAVVLWLLLCVLIGAFLHWDRFVEILGPLGFWALVIAAIIGFAMRDATLWRKDRLKWQIAGDSVLLTGVARGFAEALPGSGKGAC